MTMPADRETEILDLTIAAMHQLTARMQRSLREAGVGLAAMEARTLRFVARHPGCTQNDIVRASGRDKAQIARIIKTLLDHQFVQRMPNEPGEKRQRLLLSKAGKGPHAKAEKLRSEVARDMFAGLDAGQRDQLLSLLQQMSPAFGTDPD